MNSGALLISVEYVQLKGRECRRLVLRQVERLAARDGGRPVTGPDVVVGARAESACGRQESVDGANVGAWLPPGEDQRLIVRVGQSFSTAEFSPAGRGERIVGERHHGRGGRDRTTQQPNFRASDPD